jgi:hypothetical protein
MAQEHNDYKNYEELAGNLKGLGLGNLGVTGDTLRRYRKQQRKRYDKVAALLVEMNRKLLKQTPSNHIVLCDRAGDYVSVYSESETRVLAAPLDLAEVQTLCSTDDGKNINQRLYRLVRKGKLALREDMTMTGGATIPPCSHLVWMDKKAKEAYFVGRDGQTEKLAQALFPFVNLTRRTRRTQLLPADFGVADALKQLQKSKLELEHHLERLSAGATGDSSDSETKKPKKAKKPVSDEEKKAMEKAAKKKAEAKKKLKAMSKKHKKQAKREKDQKQKAKKRKLVDEKPAGPVQEEEEEDEEVEMEVQHVEEPAEEVEPPKKRIPYPRLIITPKSVTTSPARSVDTDSEVTEPVDAPPPLSLQPSRAELDLAWFSQTVAAM